MMEEMKEWLSGGKAAAKKAAAEKAAAEKAAAEAAYAQRWGRVVKRDPLSRKEQNQKLVADAAAKKTAEAVKAHKEKSKLLAKAAEEANINHFMPVAKKENPVARQSIFTNYIGVREAIDPNRAATLEAKLSKGNATNREHRSHEEILLERKTAWVDRNKQRRSRHDESLEKLHVQAQALVEDKKAPATAISKPSLFSQHGKDLAARRDQVIARNKAMSAQDKAARRAHEAERYGAVESQTRLGM
jgi:hypothetical protein